MGLGEMFQSGRIGFKRAFRLAALAALALGFAPGRAAAQATPIGTPITGCQASPISGSVYLTADITASSTWGTLPCITVGTDNLTVDLNGHTINVSQTKSPTVAIETGGTNGTTIVGNGNSNTGCCGTIVTGYISGSTASAIDSQGGTNVTITIKGVTLENLPPNAPPGACTPSSPSRTNQNWGIGINLNNVTGGTIQMNSAYCYQVGISVQNSVIPRGGSGSITGNTLWGNIYDMNPQDNSGAIAGTYSGGLVLSGSSGWSVTSNSIEYNGSVDGNNPPGCSVTDTVLTCAFGMQIINGSSNNDITGNTVSSNFIGGIMTGSDTAKNSVDSNTVLNNTLYDLYEVGKGHGNSFRHNICSQVGGNLTLRACQ